MPDPSLRVSRAAVARAAALLLGIAAVYFVTGKLGLSLASVAEQVTAVWPPAGIALAAVLLFGYRVWPGIWLGAFIANVTTNEPVATACGIATGNTLEALASAWLLHRVVGFRASLERLSDVLGLILLGALGATTISATIGTASLVLGGVQPWTAFGDIWRVWWVGDAMGDLVVAPVLLTWAEWLRRPEARRAGEGLGLVLALVAATGVVFVGPSHSVPSGHPLEFIVFPFVIWAALRFGPQGTATVTFVASAIAIWGTVHGSGPFAVEGSRGSLIFLQLFMGVVTVSGLLLAAAIGERRRAEDMARHNAGQLRLALEAAQLAERTSAHQAAIVESSDDAIVSKTLDGVIQSWNRGAERLFGYTTAEAIGRSISLVIPFDRLDEEDEILDRLRRGSEIEHYETVRGRKDGRHIPVSLTVSPVKDQHGTVIGASEIARDISERRRAEREREELLTREQAARAVAEAVAERLRRLQSITDAALSRVGAHRLPRELVVRVRVALNADTASVLLVDDAGDNLVVYESDGLRREVDEGIRVPIGQGFAGTIAARREPIIVEDVSTVPVVSSFLRQRVRSLLGVPMLLEDRVIGVLHVGSVQPRRFTADDAALLRLAADRLALVVHQARLYEAERRARSDAEAANRAKDEFLAMLGHELRNPLGAITNAVSVLDRIGRPNEDAARMRDVIARQTRHLARMVDDLLDVARVTTGKVTLLRQAVDLRAIAEECVVALEHRGPVRHHEIFLTGEPTLVEGDPTRLEQIITNLIDNALKYTPVGGRVEVRIEREGEQIAVLRVRDDGVGIAPDLLPHVFELFTQGRQSLDRSPGGLGVGLALVRRLVELHGGSVTASSAGLGRGSEFVVRLPLHRLAKVAETAGATERAIPRSRVLVVEDHADSRQGLRLMLEFLGQDVEEAADGSTGLERLLAARPDVAFIDIGLPGLDGYAIARATRAAPGGRSIHLVALTGYGRPEDARQAMDAGFDTHLAKPVDERALIQILTAARTTAATA